MLDKRVLQFLYDAFPLYKKQRKIFNKFDDLSPCPFDSNFVFIGSIRCKIPKYIKNIDGILFSGIQTTKPIAC